MVMSAVLRLLWFNNIHWLCNFFEPCDWLLPRPCAQGSTSILCLFFICVTLILCYELYSIVFYVFWNTCFLKFYGCVNMLMLEGPILTQSLISVWGVYICALCGGFIVAWEATLGPKRHLYCINVNRRWNNKDIILNLVRSRVISITRYLSIVIYNILHNVVWLKNNI